MTRKPPVSRADERRVELGETIDRLRLQREAAEHALAHAREALNFVHAKGAFQVSDSVVHAVNLAIFALESHLQTARRMELGAIRHMPPSQAED